MKSKWMVIGIMIIAGGAGLAYLGPRKAAAKTTDVGAGVCTARRQPFRETLVERGRFTSKERSEIRYRPEVYDGQLTVAWIIPHGTEVQEGERLIQLDTAPVNARIHQASGELKGLEIALKRTQAELEVQVSSVKSRLEQGEIAVLTAKRELEKFERMGFIRKKRDMAISMAKSEDNLKEREEDLRQLEKLYAQDKLVEETEEIVLRRARRSMQEAKESLELRKLDEAELLKYDLDWSLERMKKDLMQKEQEFARTKATVATTLEQQRFDVEKAEAGVNRKKEEIEKLKRDLAAMTVKAPRTGPIFYGSLSNASITIGGTGDQLEEGGRVRANAVLMTIPELKDFVVEMSVYETQVNRYRQGQMVSVRPEAFSDLVLTGKISRVAKLAASRNSFTSGQENKFGVEVLLDTQDPRVKPGMQCKVETLVEEAQGVLAMSAAAIFHKENRTVCYIRKDGAFAERVVKLGRTTNDLAEVLEGASEGEEAALYDPFSAN